MMQSNSSLENLIKLLVNECTKRPGLVHISEDVIRKIVHSLEKEIFSEDNRKSSISSLEKILDPIVDQIYQEDKK